MTDTAQLLVTVNVQGDAIRVKELERIFTNTLKRLPPTRIDPASVKVAWHPQTTGESK